MALLVACATGPASPAPAAPQVIEVTREVPIEVTVEVPVTATPDESGQTTSQEAIPLEEDLLEEIIQEETPVPAVRVIKEQLTRQPGEACYETLEIELAMYAALDRSSVKWRGNEANPQPAAVSVIPVNNALSEATCTYALNLDDFWVPGENILRFSSEDIRFVENLVRWVFPEEIVEIRLFMWNIHNGKPKRFVDERSFYERMPTGGFLIYLTRK